MIDPLATGPRRPSVSLPELYLSKPGIHLPAVRVDNAEIIRRVRARFKGSDAEFVPIASAIEHVFGLCKTQVRYLEPDERPGDRRRLRGRGREGLPRGQRRLAGRGRPGDLRRHRAPVLRAGDRDGGGGQAGPQAHARLRRDRGLRRPPGGDPDRGRLPGAARQLPHRAGLHVRAVGPVPELRHPDRPRPADEDRGPDDRQRGGLHAAAPEAFPGRRHPAARRSTRSRRPITGTCVRSRSAARWSRRPSS